jgi:DMSO reductase family type II enzyme chaperone
VERIAIEGKRGTDLTALPRANAYALFSQLLSSPHDIESLTLTPEISFEGLPYDFEINDILNEYIASDESELRKKYSVLFEVGDEGPPAPIREDLFLAQPAKLREDLVRFYEYFGYELNEEFQWQMDHLSIELEFIHFLAVGELKADKDRLSFQLGQYDFVEKHLNNWVPQLSKKLSMLDESDIYTKIVIELSKFLLDDFGWQKETISQVDVAGG